MYYAVTAPSVNAAELAHAYADEVVCTLALYASPDPEYMAWYPCGELDRSEEFGFTAPAFAFDGDDLLVACAVSAPDGCGARSRTAANFLSFRRFPSFRSTHAVQMPERDNRTRAYVASECFILKYYRTEDGEWQPDGVLVNDMSSLCGYSSPASLKVRGKRLLVLNSASAKFCALDLSGALLASWEGPSGCKATGMDVSEDGTRALLACGDGGVWECRLADNTWKQLAKKGADLVNARDVAILPDGGFIVSNYGWGDLYTLRYDAEGHSTRLTTKNVYFTGVTLSPDGGTCYVGKTYGSVWSINLADKTSGKIRDDIAGNPFNGTYFLSCADKKLWILSEMGFITAYDPSTGAKSAPLAQLDYPTRGIAFYEYVKPGIVIRLR
jgi:sugar lactone lactonase YvrE